MSKSALTFESMRALLRLCLLSLALGGCQTSLSASGYSSSIPGLPNERVLVGGDQPVLFLGAAPDAPAIGYASDAQLVELAGEAMNGRVPIRVPGPLEVRAHVPEALLTLRVQRRGRLRGTPVYVGPNDRVRVLGAAEEPGRVRVSVSLLIVSPPILTFEGTYPVVGVAAHQAEKDAETPEPGVLHELEKGSPLALYEAPNGKLIATIPASPIKLDVVVLRAEGEWRAVRIGQGPYLIGYTKTALKPKSATTTAMPEESARPGPSSAGVPRRLVNEQGELRRVVQGTTIAFNGETIAQLRTDGWARVLAHYPNGEVDAFVAADDGVAVRGLIAVSALRDAQVVVSATHPQATLP